ncbi:putative membrane protein [Streptomyces sp. Ncost-T6T-1]|uniref:PH domain-containing protein n=1 Tax=Streptomyces sp. Ncost-T6T-1 TaxID=1100828 RepID=UPI000805A23F|nr:PH domain-containing protein [Streptomyces sp. Ncost-T6T-1]SBV02109.1 putative membrane protein [Streptomyces sp. Ncost-T6T-1]
MTGHRAEDDAPPPPPHPLPGDAWQRLSARVIWVDLARSVLSLLPAVLAVVVVGVDPGAGEMWPLIGIAAAGVLGALADALRWAFTRYRITASHVELRTGVLVRVRRSIQRDRIRSVDIEAKPRHRLAGLRVVKIGAGQQAAAGDSALSLDAVDTAAARALHDRLIAPTHEAHPAHPVQPAHPAHPATSQAPAAAVPAPASAPAPGPERAAPLRVFARFEPRWVVYNMFNAWAYVLVLGVGWGGYWLLSGFGVDAAAFVSGLLDWRSIGWAGTAAIGFLTASVLGAAGLAVTYVVEYGKFELARVPGPDGTVLRTRQGLLTTREVSRDENRVRGVQISEPVLWRWLGVADTSLVTTGLSLWSMSQPAAILPRGPVAVARRVASEVLDPEEHPLQARLAAHPRAALRRRLWWATTTTAAVALALGWLAVTGALPYAALWAAVALWPCALGAALVAYRALGHTVSGSYLVTRSGLLSRSTTVLRRSAVSTVVIRESLLQRRLGLRSVSTMTAAGYGGYDTPDLDARASLDFAVRAAPGLLDPFLTGTGEGSPPDFPGEEGAPPGPSAEPGPRGCPQCRWGARVVGRRG